MSDTTIEEQLRSSRSLSTAMLALGFAAVAADFAIVLTERSNPFPRLLLGTIVLLAYIAILAQLGDGRFPGFRSVPWREWKRWLLVYAGAALVLGAGAIASRVWFPDRFAYGHRDIASIAVFNGCVWPIHEEVIYRFAFCAATAALLGRRWAILLNGLVFGALHFAYGNPDPSNAIGGFVLAWIYLRSGSIVVAIVGHSIGNCAINFAPLVFGALT